MRQGCGMVALPDRFYQRATALLTDPGHRLLVFEHVDAPGAGVQVPAGGIKVDESPEEAVKRELEEESGISSARLVRMLGASWFVAPEGQVAEGLEEQVHHAFHLQLDEPTERDQWEWDECSDGGGPLYRFAFRWVDLATAEQILHPIQAMWITSLRASLDHL